MKNLFDENIFITNIVSIATVNTNTNKIHKNRVCHCIAYNISGEKTYHFEGEEPYTVNDDCFLYFSKGSNYIAEFSSPGCTFAINFDSDSDDIFNHIHYYVKNRNLITTLFKKAELIWRTKHTGYYQKCLSLIYEILYLMTNEINPEYIPMSKKAFLSPAIRYIDNNFHREIISVSHLAELCNVSEVYFRSIFKSMYGTSPIKYINSLKLTRAKELLCCEDIPINEVAYMSGYNDTSTFSREFKKATGITPIYYRKNHTK